MMRPTPGSSPLRGRQGRRAVGLVGLVGAWCLALQGCASLAGTQHPFKNAPAPEITEIVASPSVMVAPVGGPPPQVGRVLAELVADALRQRDVLAVTRDPAPGSMLLAGHAEMVPEAKDHALLRVTWSLIQPDGLTTGTFQSEQTIPVLPGKDPYQRLSASAMVPFANRAAFRTADLIQNPPKPVQVASNADVAVPGAADADADTDTADQGMDAGPARPSKTAEKDEAAPKAKPEAGIARKSDKAAKAAEADIAEKPQPKDSTARRAEARPAPKPAERPKPETVAQPTSIMADIRADEADLAPSSFGKEAADRPAANPAPEPAVAKTAMAEQSPASAAVKPAMVEPPPAKAATPKPPPAKIAAARPAEPPKPAAAAQAEPVPAGPAKAAPAPQAVTDLQQASLAAAMSKGEKKKAAREARSAQKEPGHAEKAESASGTAGGVRVASAVATTAAGAGLIGTVEALKAGASAPAALQQPAPAQSIPTAPAAQPKPDKEAATPAAESKAQHQPETASHAAQAPTQIAANMPATSTPAADKSPPTATVTPQPVAAPAPKPAPPAPQPPAPQPPASDTGASESAAPPETHSTEAKATTPPTAPTRPSMPEPTAAQSPPPAPRQTASLPAAPAAPRAPITSLIVAPVQGAPGNGNQMLAAAIKQALQGAGLQVGDYSRGPQTAVLHGRVSVADAGGDADDVNIEWAVYDSTGRFLGTVTQHNRLPRSLVEGRWDETAGMAAAGAVTGIRRLIAQPTAGGAS